MQRAIAVAQDRIALVARAVQRHVDLLGARRSVADHRQRRRGAVRRPRARRRQLVGPHAERRGRECAGALGGELCRWIVPVDAALGKEPLVARGAGGEAGRGVAAVRGAARLIDELGADADRDAEAGEHLEHLGVADQRSAVGQHELELDRCVEREARRIVDLHQETAPRHLLGHVIAQLAVAGIRDSEQDMRSGHFDAL